MVGRKERGGDNVRGKLREGLRERERLSVCV